MLVRGRSVLVRKNQKRYLYRAIDEDGVVIDILLREHRDTASAEAFFHQAIKRSGVIPDEVVTDHHQPYVKAVAITCPGVQHIRTGLHRARGETTKAIERSHVPMRDRLRNSRGLKRTETGQRFLEGFEAMRHLRRDGRPGAGHLVRGPAPHAARSGGSGGDPRHRAWSASPALNISAPWASWYQGRLGWLAPTQHSTSFRTLLEGFEAMRHLRRDGRPGAGHLVRGLAPHARVREAVAAIHAIGHGLLRQL